VSARRRAVSWLATLLELPLVRKDALAPRDAIVVLGAPLGRGDALSAIGAERVEAALDLWQRGGAPKIVVTGGVTRRASRPEAAVMADALAAGGVPRSAIVVEDAAQSTAENARLTAALLGPASVWIVTQPFHGRRAAYLFARVGLDPKVWHIDGSLEYRDRRRAARWLLREYGAWLRLLTRRSPG
jgi:uncharacterized SAM-binding protein YcdF (DUF218 family)